MAGLLGLAGFPARAAHTQAALVLEAGTAQAGETIWAALRLRMDPGWHTYWKNAGEGGLGMPTKITWQLPPGVTAGEIHWPVPEKLVAADATTYVLSDEAALLIPLTLAKDLPPGSLTLTGKVSWLECQTACVPGKATVTASLSVGDRTEPSEEAAAFAAWRAKLPKAGESLPISARWELPANADKRPLLLELTAPNQADSADFLPYPDENFEVLGKTEAVGSRAGIISLRKVVQKYEGDWPKQIEGLLILNGGASSGGYEVKLALGAKPAAAEPTQIAPATPAAAPTSTASGKTQSLGLMLLYAFLGGLILNIMPCVLPVIALKILGFVGQAKQSPGRVRVLGLLYTAGVFASFLVLAALVISVKAAGQRAGWGMQFSNPYFIVAITALVTLVALNLFGVFEVTLSGRVMGAAGNLAAQHGASGAFFNGVLATVLATPCTAPFLGAALGFAFLQPAAVVVLMFLTVGAGLAAPYLLLAWQPQWVKFLPKPGAWMEKFKIAMGFPMLATALWLGSLATSFYGERTWWLGVFLVCVGAAAWTFGEFFQRGGKRRGLALVITLLLLFIGYAWALNGGLRWRAPETGAGKEASLKHAPEGYAWQPWSAEAVARARAAGRMVVVDFTAKWCQICNVSVKPAFENESVIARLKQLDAVALVADYTLRPQAITDELARFERAGVPMVLVYPPDATKPPAVLPEPLPYPAPYSPVVLDALNQATR